jgi:GTPase-associated protein 1, N-terminal domain type 2
MTNSTAIFEQAIFTSCQSSDNEGYQIAAASPGIDAATSKELSAWGPAHDSLHPRLPATGSVNVHPLSEGRTCISVTRNDDDEYSGRGIRVTTHLLIADAPTLARFGNHPLRVLDAATAAAWPAQSQGKRKLDRLTLTATSRSVNPDTLARATRIIGGIGLTAVLHALARSQHLGLVVPHSRQLLLDAIYSSLPIAERPKLSATTGLLPSLRRPYQLHVLPADGTLHRSFERMFQASILDLTQPILAADLPRGEPWSRILALLSDERWSDLARLIAGPDYRLNLQTAA